MKILFLAANPVDELNWLRVDEEIREISQRIRLGRLRHRLELTSEWGVRVGDFQELLLRHQPSIVHFSGHARENGGILLEEKSGSSQEVDSQAVTDLFRILKDDIRMVVFNACYSKHQAMKVAETVDYTIGMNSSTGDEAAVVFAAHFYQSLAFGRSVQEGFDLAVNQLKLEGLESELVPELLVREGADASKPLITEESHKKLRPVDLLPGMFTSLALAIAFNIAARFLGIESNLLDIAATSAQVLFLSLSGILLALALGVLVLPGNPSLQRAANRVAWKGGLSSAKAALLSAIILIAMAGAWRALPVFARSYNERGFEYFEANDLTSARRYYRLALRLNPFYAAAHYNLAAVSEDLEPQEAITQYLLAIKYDSRIYPAYNQLARLYLLRGKGSDCQDALNVLNQALELSPQDSKVQYSIYKNLGWADFALKDFRQSENYLRKAISVKPDAAAAHCLLAYVLKAEGRNKEAEDECFDCVRFSPGEKDVEAKWVNDAQECLIERGTTK